MSASTLTFHVTGITCRHCVDSVTSEVTGVAGVSSVVVDLPGGQVEVSGRNVDPATVIAAIAEAGYAASPG